MFSAELLTQAEWGRRLCEDTRLYTEGKLKGPSVAEHGVDGTRKTVPTWMSELNRERKEKRREEQL